MSPQIVTSHDFPPIPDRRFDWSACYEGRGEYGPYGRGPTEAAAIADLKDNYDAPEPPASLLDAVNDRRAQLLADSREYWRAFNAAHADAYRSRSSSDPALAEHYAALAHVGFGYARALRTGDWSKTSIRPLSHFIPSTQKDKAA